MLEKIKKKDTSERAERLWQGRAFFQVPAYSVATPNADVVKHTGANLRKESSGKEFRTMS